MADRRVSRTQLLRNAVGYSHKTASLVTPVSSRTVSERLRIPNSSIFCTSRTTLAIPGIGSGPLAAVKQPEFWHENYLFSDRRVPVSLIGTNAGRALATNRIAGHMWEDFTSNTYKQLPPVGQIQFFNPYKPQSGGATFNDKFEAPAW
jgi:hypothetical protein